MSCSRVNTAMISSNELIRWSSTSDLLRLRNIGRLERSRSTRMRWLQSDIRCPTYTGMQPHTPITLIQFVVDWKEGSSWFPVRWHHWNDAGAPPLLPTIGCSYCKWYIFSSDRETGNRDLADWMSPQNPYTMPYMHCTRPCRRLTTCYFTPLCSAWITWYRAALWCFTFPSRWCWRHRRTNTDDCSSCQRSLSGSCWQIWKHSQESCLLPILKKHGHRNK